MENLKNALDSNDLKGAQEAYSKIQSKMSQGKPAGAPAGGHPPKGGPGGGSTASSASSSKTYDKMDLNKDGTVSDLERLTYELEHPDSSSEASTDQSEKTEGEPGIDTYA
jgi:hypothetical protein